MSAVKAALGLLLIGAYFATNLGEFGQFASRRSTFFLVSTIATVLVVLVGPRRRELRGGEEGQELGPHQQEDLHPRAPDQEHPRLAQGEGAGAAPSSPPSDPDYEQVDRLLQRYREQAPDRFEVAFKDPRKAPDLAQKYQLREGQTTVVLTRGAGDKENHTTVSVSNGSPSRTSPTRCSS